MFTAAGPSTQPQMRTHESVHTSTHTQPGLCGSRFDAGLINDFITVEALNGMRGKARIRDEE